MSGALVADEIPLPPEESADASQAGNFQQCAAVKRGVCSLRSPLPSWERVRVRGGERGRRPLTLLAFGKLSLSRGGRGSEGRALFQLVGLHG